jgi:hypothetical protein
LAGALSFDEKIRQSAPLFWFGLRNDGCKPQPKEQFMSLPHFWSMVRRNRSWFEHMQTVNRTSRRIRGLLHGEAQQFELLSNIQDQKLKIKNIYIG